MKNYEDFIRNTHRSERSIIIAFSVNAALTVLEVAAGFLSGSLSILAHALHDFGDSTSLVSSWYFERSVRKGRSTILTLGYSRLPVAASITVSLLLMGFSAVIILTAVGRIVSPSGISARGMLLTAGAGILFNCIAAVLMRRKTRISEQLILLHFIEDIFGWFLILSVSAIMYTVNLPVLDPILAVLSAGFILFRALFKLSRTFILFMQSIPVDLNLQQIRKSLLSIAGVIDFHSFRAWSIDGERNCAMISLVTENNLGHRDYDRIREDCRMVLAGNSVCEVTVLIEFAGIDGR